MTEVTVARRRTTSAVLIYLIVLMSFQIFLVTVADQAFMTASKSLAWATAAVSVVLAFLAALCLRFLRH
ncbi:MAG: hypothetical protein F2942_10185 [Actinobacteria bacterium]|jgi:hypothetical protein|uniref:Unannotated protein n=1 Tax=freshwater metagenome TaxID=449393 RepID=A0A6J7UTJ7_9ZZZZ|nr:hypothetical protein [Actinomycetota bacterium]MSX75240.1 hypothetical protein [Actinomycetota bacterium]MSY22272.1 hypothetical protein [Actinomycetota bacterium]MTA75074.1 hypothetical protein [Actinomycetota bacterium]